MIVSYLGWLEPLLGRIAEDKKHVVTPVIENVIDEDFSYQGTRPEGIFVGKFNWELTFDWMPIPDYIKKNMTTPISPVRSELSLLVVLAMCGLLELDLQGP